DLGRLGIAAQAVGIADAALEYALGYAAEREQFGRKLKEFEGMQFKLAEMATRVEAARSLTARAAAAPSTRASAMAKLFASEAAMWVTTQAVQVCGGYGYMRDYPVEKLMRDAKATEIYEGTNEVLRVVIARELYRSGGDGAGPVAGGIHGGRAWRSSRRSASTTTSRSSSVTSRPRVTAGSSRSTTRRSVRRSAGRGS